MDGVRISYTEAGDGPPVLLLHGMVFGGNGFWLDTQAALAPYARTIAPDLPGWGASDKPDVEYTADFYHSFIERFIETLGLGPVVLVGHSMGGLMVTSFAPFHPELVRGVVSVAAPPPWIDLVVPALFRPLLYPAIGEALMLLTSWALHPLLGSRRYYEALFCNRQDIREERLLAVAEAGWLAVTYSSHRQAVLSTFRSNAGYCSAERIADLQRRVPAIAGPVLFVAGRNDPLFAPELITQGASVHPAARVEILPDCGHFPMWEQTERTMGLLIEVIRAAWLPEDLQAA